jgi:HSP20 family molecular chaperone IbpA
LSQKGQPGEALDDNKKRPIVEDMRRMYVTLGVIFLVFLAGFILVGRMISFAQNPIDDGLRKRLELREEMHKRIRDKLIYGIGPDQDMFKDIEQMFEESMSESLSGFSVRSNAFQTEWQENSSGRTLIITPQSPEQKLNIDVNSSMITIKGESVQKSNGSTVSSSFSNSFSVPDDCDGSRVQMDQKDGKILVHLPYRSSKTQLPEIKLKKPERKPLPPSTDDVQI